MFALVLICAVLVGFCACCFVVWRLLLFVSGFCCLLLDLWLLCCFACLDLIFMVWLLDFVVLGRLLLVCGLFRLFGCLIFVYDVLWMFVFLIFLLDCYVYLHCF